MAEYEKKLPPKQEREFMSVYKALARRRRLNPDPDDPRHFYKHREAWKAGALKADESGHGLSQFKRLGHPNLIVPKPPFRYGMDTRTGKPATPELVRDNKRARLRVEAEIAKAKAHP